MAHLEGLEPEDVAMAVTYPDMRTRLVEGLAYMTSPHPERDEGRFDDHFMAIEDTLDPPNGIAGMVGAVLEADEVEAAVAAWSALEAVADSLGPTASLDSWTAHEGWPRFVEAAKTLLRTMERRKAA
jgi:hypothetical protein